MEYTSFTTTVIKAEQVPFLFAGGPALCAVDIPDRRDL